MKNLGGCEYYSNSDDAELVAYALSGSGDAFAELVIRYSELVLAAISGYVRDEYLVEEIAQDSFVDAFLGLSRLREPSKFAPWIYGIAKRKAQHAVTRRRYTEDVDELADIMADDRNPEEQILSDEKKLAIRSAVKRLSPKNRVVVEMYYFDEMTVAQIAERLGLSQGTIKSRLYEARNKMKGALESMEENRTNTEKLERSILEKIYKVMAYHKIYGEGSSEFENLFEETQQLINKENDPSVKRKAQETLYQNIHSEKFRTEEEYREVLRENDPGMLKTREFQGKLWEPRSENEYIYDRFIDVVNEAMREPDVRECPGSAGLLFWRARAYIEKNMIDEARADFEAAIKIAEPNDLYHALSRLALNELDLLRDNCSSPTVGMNVTAERYIRLGNSVCFYNQPGFGTETVLWYCHKYDYINYFISRCRNTFFDTDMKPGESIIDENEECTLTLVGYNEKLIVPAGKFEGCMKLRYNSNQYNADVWYGKNIGLLKAVFYEGFISDTYELSEYEIHGGSGYLPFAAGNRWRYSNPKVPDYLFSRFEHEIDWTDGISCTMMIMHVVAYKKGFDENNVDDANLNIEQCEKLAARHDLTGAIEELKTAVRLNSNTETTIAGLYGIDYLEKCLEVQQRKYRLCPSSFNLASIEVCGGYTNYYENSICSFGPYRFGSRFEENRIFGVKVFRYLQDITNHIWSDKWTPGYTEEKKVDIFGEEAHISLNVQEDGMIETAAGVFENTICLTTDFRYASLEGNYYFDEEYMHVNGGVKKFWFAPGVGIVRFDCIWGDMLTSISELVDYRCPAARDDEYMPIEIGNHWLYEEKNLAAEGYRAVRDITVRAGMADKYLVTDNQEFWYLGTEDEYEEAKRSGFRRGE